MNHDHSPAVRGLRVSTALWTGSGMLVAAVLLGAWIFFLRQNTPFAIDEWWNATLAASRGDALLWVSYAMNWLGGGWFGIIGMPVILILLLIVLKRPWSTLYFVATLVLSVLLVQVLKHTFGRARPADIVVVSDFGSFPSGHVANAATVAVAMWVIFPRVWVAIVGAAWILLMAFSRTYLGAHWLTDTIGGALIGAAAALLMAAAFTGVLARDHRLRVSSAATGAELAAADDVDGSAPPR